MSDTVSAPWTLLNENGQGPRPNVVTVTNKIDNKKHFRYD